jgi:hypothetical protein
MVKSPLLEGFLFAGNNLIVFTSIILKQANKPE